jgi:hypothetical protein
MSKSHLSVSVALALMAACNDPATKDPPPPLCYEIPGECDDTGDTGTERIETGGDETGSTGPEMLGVGECVFNPDENKIGLQYNCFGELHTSIDLAIAGLFPTCEALFDDDAWCSDDFYFDYEPQVVACCGEYDIALKLEFQKFCTFDLYQQLCSSLAEQLEYLVQKGTFGSYGDKGVELQQYVAAHHSDCFNAFMANNVATVPFVDTHWALPEDFGLLEDVVFHIEPNTRIDGVNGPASGEEWPTCEGARYNDDTFFGNTGNRQPLGGIVAGVDLADPVHAELSGPVILGGAVSAAVDFGTFCTALGCPMAMFSYDQEGRRFGLEQLALIGDSFEISNGTYSLTAERVQVRLHSQAAGSQVIDPSSGISLGYEVPAGEASFSVAGIAGETANRFMAVNATSIWVVPKERGVWEVDAFLLEYEDGNRERWTVMIAGSSWR